MLTKTLKDYAEYKMAICYAKRQKDTRPLGQSKFLTSPVAVFVMLGNTVYFTGPWFPRLKRGIKKM